MKHTESFFVSDNPIDSDGADFLGYQAFADYIVDMLRSVPSNSPFAVALCGSWGQGKTSVLNLARAQMKKHFKVMKFAPWNITCKDVLISDFFNQLKIVIKWDREPQFFNLINKYSSLVCNGAKYIPAVGENIEAVLNFFRESVGELTYQESNSVSELKEQIEKKLLKLKKPVLVIIDDIDRLSQEEIRLVFQLVKEVAGFPNIIYLLSFDPDIVASALGAVQNCNGAEYMKKFVQLILFMPHFEKAKLFDFFIYKIEKEYGKHLEGDALKRVKNAFWGVILLHINNVRDAILVYNTLVAYHSAMRKAYIANTNKEANEDSDYVDFSCLMIVSAMAVLCPGFYNFVKRHSLIFCDGDKNEHLLQYLDSIGYFEGHSFTDDTSEEKKDSANMLPIRPEKKKVEKYLYWLKNELSVSESDFEFVCDVIKLTFPHFAFYLGFGTPELRPLSNYGLVSDAMYFGVFFNPFSLKPDTVFEKLLGEYTQAELDTAVSDNIKNNIWRSAFFSYIGNHIGFYAEKDKGRLEFVLISLMRYADLIEEENTERDYASDYEMCVRICIRLMVEIGFGKIGLLFRDIFFANDFENMCTVLSKIFFECQPEYAERNSTLKVFPSQEKYSEYLDLYCNKLKTIKDRIPLMLKNGRCSLLNLLLKQKADFLQKEFSEWLEDSDNFLDIVKALENVWNVNTREKDKSPKDDLISKYPFKALKESEQYLDGFLKRHFRELPQNDILLLASFTVKLSLESNCSSVDDVYSLWQKNY